MADERVLEDGGFRVTVLEPTSIVDGSGDAAAAFERAWDRLPPFVEDNSFCALDDDGGVFLKGQRIRPRFHTESLRQAGRLSRETRFMLRMHAAGLPVPEVLAYGVQRHFGVSVRAFLLLRLLPGAEDLRSVIRRTTPEERADVWEPVGRLVTQLHDTHLFHRDLTARNVLVRRDDKSDERGVRAHLIDCPRAEHGSFGPRRSFLRRSDLFRLGRSVLKAGGEESEVRALLAAARTPQPDALCEVIARSARKGGERSLRTKLWVAFGV